MLHCGEDDILLDDSIRYGQGIEREGGTSEVHTWQGMVHVFPSNVAMLKAAKEALDSIGGFLRQSLFSNSTPAGVNTK